MAVVAAGGLGLLAHAAEGPEYPRRLEVLFLGATILGWAGPALFVGRKAKEGRRILYLLLATLAARIAYLPALQGAVLFAGWLEQLGRATGVGRFGAPLHYALGCLHAALVCFAALVVVSSAAHARRPACIAVFVLLAAAGALAFSHAEDRALLPHEIAAEDLQPAAEGAGYLDVAEDGSRDARTRILATLYGLADVVSPRSGWAGAVRAELHARFRADPGMSLRARATSIAGALTTARSLLRTSPRTPPA